MRRQGSPGLRRRLDRKGKIFSLGLLLMYVLAAIAGLFLVLTRFTGAVDKLGTGAALGDVQGAMLAAYERADQKISYLSAAGGQAAELAAKQLYEDQGAFFATMEGDSSAGLGCGSYGYPLWNTREKGCLVGEGLAGALKRITDAMAPRIMELLAQRTAAYPAGGFGVSYDILPSLKQGALLIQFAKRADLQEPIFLGLPASAPADSVAQKLEGGGAVQGLSWPGGDSAKIITSCFGPRPGVAAAASDIHAGMDFAPGSSVVAAADGTVMNDPQATAYGTVWIKHSDKLSTGYLHLDKSTITVKRGDAVKAGQALGKPGNTGCAAQGCPVHLHFEVLVPGPAGSHSYPSSYAPGWYAVNPACFFPSISDNQISPSATDSCLAPSYPKPATQAYCTEYGLTLTPQTSPTSPAPGATRPSQSMPTLAPDAPPTANQQKLRDTWQRMNDQGWGGYVIKAAADTGLNQALILGVITQESVGDPLAISDTGCAGLMQICKGTGEGEAALSGRMTLCGNSCKKQGTCKCTPENDQRLHADVNVAAGASILKKKLSLFASYTDRVRFGVASYNIGEGVIKSAIHATGKADPSWTEVVPYLKANPSQVKQVTDYVPLVMAYTAAWNAGVPVDAGHAAAVSQARSEYGSFELLGTYTYDPSFMVKAPDTLTPFVSLLAWADTTLTTCSSADVPGECLLSEAAKAKPAVSQSCEQDAGSQYFLDLYQALRDCSENKQYGCQCALPPPPSSADGEYLFSYDETNHDAVLTKDGAPVPSLSFENVTGRTLRVAAGTPEGVVPTSLNITLSKDGKATVQFIETGTASAIAWQPGWVAEKSADSHLILRKDALATELCAPVKLEYALCSKILSDMPAVKFSLTLKDSAKPTPPTNLNYNPATKTLAFTPSASKDTSFYNVYDAQPSGSQPSAGPTPILQLREGKTSLDATPYAGKTLYITSVDKAGNEGDAASLAIPAPSTPATN